MANVVGQGENAGIQSAVQNCFDFFFFQPFGEGLVTVVLSQLRRGENNIFLWNNNSLDQPVHQFTGHSDVVLEFQWRKKHESKNNLSTIFLERHSGQVQIILLFITSMRRQMKSS